ncbi:MAG: signal recognition particle-docking protein FtsY [Deltaproteobacteria bacterium]|nr:signal recognition particle-docking protein FtsY [Deltaproteobacteria bacterium]
MPGWASPELLLWGGAWVVALLIVAIGSLVRGRRAKPRVSARPGDAKAVPTAKRPAGEPEVAPKQRFRLGLAKSRELLAGRIRSAFGRDQSAEAIFEEVEQGLIESDVGVRSSQRLLGVLRSLPAAERNAPAVRSALRRELQGLLGEASAEPASLEAKPWVCLVVGVNGVGKTTTIGKLAARHRAAGRKVLIIAGDTFRAAAIDQLGVWAERTGADIVHQAPGADPAAVVFDGMSAAAARGVDVVLIDTAGRLHTKVNLMEELKKVRRVVERVVPGAPHEVLLVLDATTGQNALSQARTFSDAVTVTGVVLSKLDGSARGGMAVAIRHELDLPVRYVGLGESAADLQPFDPESFLDGLLPADDSP